MRLVRCVPATPPPLATDAVENPNVIRRRVGFSSGRLSIVGKRPAVHLGTISATGAVTIAEVTALARAKQVEMLACFGGSSMTRVAMIYRLTIGSDGVVGSVGPSEVSTATTVFSVKSDQCVRRTLRSMKFASKGSTTAVAIPIVYDSTGTFAMPDEPPTVAAIEPDPWTPFATDGKSVAATAITTARVTEAAIRGKVADIDKCFANPASTGSLRILLELDVAGELSSVRAGGIGDKDAELCAAKSLAGLKVMTPSQEHVEIACDLARGDASPWRVSPGAGYELIEIDARGLKHADEIVVPGVSEPDPLPADTYVVVARPDTLGGMLQLALMWARDATAVVLAVGDGKTPPVFLGMGNAQPADEESDALRPAIRVGKQFATGCVGRATHKAAVSSSTELGGLIQKLAAKCRTLRCAPTLVVAIDTDAVAKDLLEVAGAARRGGFDRVLFGGAELGCTATPKKPTGEVDIEPDFE